MQVNVNDVIDSARFNTYHLRILLLAASLIFFDGFDLQVVSYTAGDLARAVGITRPMLGPMFSAGLGGLAVGALLFGLLGDRWGRKPVFILCGVLFGLATLGTTTATSFGQVMVWRILAGLGLGGATPMSITISTECSPRRLRTTLIMLVYISFAIGGVVGGAVSAWLVQFGWQAPYYAGGIIPLLLAPLIAAAMPESVGHLVLRGGEPAAVTALLARLNPAARLQGVNGFTMITDAGTGLQVRRLFQSGFAPRTILLWLIFFFSLITLFFYASWLPNLLRGQGLTQAETVFVTGAVQFGGLAGSLVFARAVLSIKPFSAIMSGYAIAALLMAVLSQFVAGSLVLTIYNFILGLFLVGTQNCLNAMCGQLYPTSIRSTGVGWAIGVGRIGSVLGPSLAGMLLALDWTPSQLFLIAALPSLAAAGFAAVLAELVRAPVQEVSRAT